MVERSLRPISRRVRGARVYDFDGGFTGESEAGVLDEARGFGEELFVQS